MTGKIIASKQESMPSCPHARNVVCDKNRVHCRIRRLIVVASLYFKLKGVKSPDQQELDCLNGKLQLAFTSGALLLPAAIAGWIWRKIDPNLLVERFQQGDCDLSTLSRELDSTLPAWCRYGDGSSFTMDVRGVLDCLRTATA
jgi:hypothetical protein